MNNCQLLDEILLSDNVCQNFHKEYKDNNEFHRWLSSLLPEIKTCFMPQNNPWHVYSVIDHILHSVEEMNKLSLGYDGKTRRRLAYTMFLHDIGKPECHIKRQKNGVLIDSFFNHNIASERIAKRVLKDFNFDKNECKIIEKLVYKHDIFMFLTLDKTTNPHHKQLSNDVIKNEIADLNSVGNGAELLKQLIMVGRSDSKSQNPAMTKNSLILLDAMENKLKNLNVENNSNLEK